MRQQLKVGEQFRRGNALPRGIDIEIWWHDEACIGKKNKITRRWAGWHATTKLMVPDNVTLLLLPPRA